MNSLAILCVDDEVMVLDVLSRQLSHCLQEQVKIVTAETAEEAEDVIPKLQKEGYEIAVLIVDYHLPGMSGRELLLNLNSQLPQTLKILLTGNISPENFEQTVQQTNLYRYITKPWDELDLQLTVQEAIRRYQQDLTLAQQNQDLKQLNIELEKKVTERTAELLTANHKLHQQITKLQWVEEELQFLLKLSQAISSATDFETAIEIALKSLCQRTNWTYGEVWLPSVDETVLECSPIWYCNCQDKEPEEIASIHQFRLPLKGITFQPGEGIAGRVWQTKKTEWIPDIYQSLDCKTIPPVSYPHLVQHPAKNYGFRARFGVPILGSKITHENDIIAATQDQVISGYNSNYSLSNSHYLLGQNIQSPVLAVLVFFIKDAQAENERFTQLISTVTTQLGTVLQQKKTEAGMKALFAAMTEVVMVFDSHGRCLQIAPTNLSQFSQVTEQLIGTTLDDHFPKAEAHQLLNKIHRSLQTQQTVQVEYRLNIQQQDIWFSASISPLSDQTVIWVSQDITRRKQMEEELKTNEEKYRHIIQNVSSVIVRWDARGYIQFINAYGLDFFGYSEAELIGKNLSDTLIPQTEKSGRDLSQLVEQICQNPEDYSIYENENICKNGKRVWVTWVNQPIYDKKGDLIEILSVATDTTQRRLAEQALRVEQEKSERLLLNILPKRIADQLKQTKGEVIAEKFDEVTILFADIVGFTPLSERLHPMELVKLLNHIFSTFDQLAEVLDLEKIKTIGDAYMVAAGLPIPREDHAEVIADMALSMQVAVDHFLFDRGETLQVRIGINTGMAVAGVIGTKKFIYDLWGDAVNVACRMESTGEAGKIQVTQATYEQLKDQYLLEKRGSTEVKGKGEMTTYWLLERK
ncbi:MAG: adenylate/guanylate cyclase domain-containing protein [Microcoleaceae cyanobacterium]